MLMNVNVSFQEQPSPRQKGSRWMPCHWGIPSSLDLPSLERNRCRCCCLRRLFLPLAPASPVRQKRNRGHKMDSDSNYGSRIVWETINRCHIKKLPEFCRGGWGWVGNVVAVRKAMWTELCAVAFSLHHHNPKFTGCPRVTCCWVRSLEITKI